MQFIYICQYVRAEVQILLAEEQITLSQLQQTKAQLEIRLLKVEFQKAGLSTTKDKLSKFFNLVIYWTFSHFQFFKHIFKIFTLYL